LFVTGTPINEKPNGEPLGFGGEPGGSVGVGACHRFGYIDQGGCLHVIIDDRLGNPFGLI
jgi:hypothetical protein